MESLLCAPSSMGSVSDRKYKITSIFLVGHLTSDASDGMRGHVKMLVEQHQQLEHRIASSSEASVIIHVLRQTSNYSSTVIIK